MGRLDKKAALITGAASGIGRAIAELFAAEGAKVAVVDLNQNGMDVVSKIKEMGEQATFIQADVSKSGDVRRMVNACIKDYGHIDILVNNAGVEQPIVATADIPEDVWDHVINVHLKGVFLGMKYAIPQMVHRGGVIISTASTAGMVGFPYHGAYGAAKAGIIGLTKTVALEYADRNIRVNCICPGLVQTPMIERVRKMPEWAANKPARSPYAINRRGRPEEIAQAALFLASDESSSFITGTALIVDGGYTAF